MADLIGTTLDQYQIVEQIGVGGMATVYKAYQPSINRYVAIKVLPAQLARDPNFVKRFEHEARAIAGLEHPHILPVYDFGARGDLYYMVMRYVPTGTLSNLMDKSLPPARIVQAIGNVARALDYAHQQNIVHRDIKPSNILIDKNGEVLLTDFGIAKIMLEGSEGTQLTGTGSILGTPAYMAPEQAKGAAIDRRTDIYSLGVVLYELVTGQPPYQADTALAVVLKHINEPLPMPRSVNPQVPEPLERVVVKAMAKDPNQRYQTAAEMERALHDALREIEMAGTTASINRPATQRIPGVSSSTGPAAPARRSSKGPLIIGGVLVAALLCLLTGGTGLFLLLPGSGTPTTRATAEARTTLQVSQPSPTPPAATPEPVTNPTVEIEPVYNTPLEEGVLFRDTFDSDRYCWADEGNHLYGSFKSEIVDGHFRSGMNAKQGAVLWGFLPGADFADFVASVEAQPVADGDLPLGYGLIFRGNPKGDYYLFQIRGDNAFAVYLIKHDQDEWQQLISPKISAAVQAAGPNLLAVQAIRSDFTFFINGQEVGTVSDETLPVGYVGLLTEIDEGKSSRVDYDNLEVRLPDGYAPDEGGQIIMAECFNDDSNGWIAGTFTDTGFQSQTTIDGDYTVDLTARQKDGYVYRDAMTVQDFSDFSAAVEVTPADNETDHTFGLVFRNTGATFYTFEIGNDGRYGVYLYNEQWQTLAEGNTKSVFSAQPNEVRVVAQASDLAFYVNGDRVASVTDDTTLSGKMGLVTTVLEQDQSATVSFDNLVISKVGRLNGAEVAYQEETINSGILFSDAFDSDGSGWSTGEFEDDYAITEITIENGVYTLAATAKKPAYIEKVLPSRQFSDFVLTMEATPLDSEDHYSYGIAFREDADYHTYAFEIGNDGLYSVQVYDGEWRKLKDWSSTEAIKVGQTNELKVIANGSSLTFFVNGVQLTSLQDNTLARGKIGLIVDIFEEGTSATINFDNLTLRTLESAQ